MRNSCQLVLTFLLMAPDFFPFSLPYPAWLYVLACCLALCLDSGNRFWIVFYGPDWETWYDYPLVASGFSLWCKCTKIMGGQPLHSLPRSLPIWAYQPPAHAPSTMPLCFCPEGRPQPSPRRLRRAVPGNVIVAMRSQRYIQSVTEVLCPTLEFVHNRMPC